MSDLDLDRGAGVVPDLADLLARVREGTLDVDDALERLRGWPVADLGHTRLDLQRSERCGYPEVVFGAGKTPRQLIDIARTILARHEHLLVTRINEDGAAALLSECPDAVHHEAARALTVDRRPERELEGSVVVVSAGTSDRSVAEEALVTARALGARAEHLADVGVAGLHRVLD